MGTPCFECFPALSSIHVFYESLRISVLCQPKEQLWALHLHPLLRQVNCGIAPLQQCVIKSNIPSANKVLEKGSLEEHSCL